MPILAALGWDTLDPEQVLDEYPLKNGGRADIALRPPGKRRVLCIVELKSMSRELKEEDAQQLFGYAFHTGVPLVLLTNGATWRFYSIRAWGSYDERLVCELDLEAESTERVAGALERYLSFDNTKNEQAASHAFEDLRARLARVEAKAALPGAWARLVENEPHQDLVRLMIETTDSLNVARPAPEDVASFLRGLTPETGSTPRPLPRGARTTEAHRRRKTQQPSIPKAPPRRAGRWGVRVVYVLLGEKREAKNAKAAYVDIFTTLAERDSAFLSEVEPRLRGRKNRKVARSRHELTPTAGMQKSAVELPKGWWLLTHLSNLQKRQALEIACKVAGLRFGDPSGLDIRFPNT